MADRENEFDSTISLISKGVLSSYEVTKLIAVRQPLNENMATGQVSLRELALGIKTELDLVMQCKRKVPGGKNAPDDVWVMYTFMCQRIITLFQYMHQHFSIDNDMLGYILMFCNNNAIYLNEDNLVFLIEIISNTENNENLWIELVNLYAKIEVYDKMLDIFKQAVKSSTLTVLPLWNLIISFITTFNPTMIETAFEVGSQMTSENVAEEIRFQYFKWYTDNNSDIIAIRKLFEDLKDLNPPSLRLYELMISIETNRRNSRIIVVRQLFTEACTKFGKTNPGIWAKCIHFEFSTKNPSLANKLMSNSLECLDPDQRDNMLDIIEKISSEFKQSTKKIKEFK